MEKSEQRLHADSPGVFRKKVSVVVRRFFDQPRLGIGHSSDWVCGSVTDNALVTGIQGGGSSFWLAGKAFGFLNLTEYTTKVSLCFRSESDMKVRVEWSASIVDPSGKLLQTSATSCDTFVKENGKYQEGKYVKPQDHTYDRRRLKDKGFALHEDIKEKGWLFDGDLHLVADIRFKVLNGGHPKTSASAGSFLTALRTQLDSPVLSDFTLISGDGVDIRTHKLVLALGSPVFRAMFESDMEEARSGVCKIEDAESVSIKAMLAFMIGVEPEEWTFDLAKGLFQLADKYELTDLLQRSTIELAKAITMDNLTELLVLAYQHSSKVLLNEAFQYLEDNLKQATMEGVFVRLASEQMSVALFHEWQAHWFRRLEGIDLGKSSEVDKE